MCAAIRAWWRHLASPGPPPHLPRLVIPLVQRANGSPGRVTGLFASWETQNSCSMKAGGSSVPGSTVGAVRDATSYMPDLATPPPVYFLSCSVKAARAQLDRFK